MPKSAFSRTYIDFSKEKATVEMRVRDMTAATIAALLTELATLGSALDALSIGNLTRSIAAQDSTPFIETPPTDENAQRERKWRVSYQDTVNLKVGKVEIPAAKVNNGTDSLLLPNSDIADLSVTEWTDFIDAFETTARSVDGNAVTVMTAQLVGRNL